MKTKKVYFDTGFLLDSKQIKEVTLDEPNPRAMKGLSRMSLFQMDDEAFRRLIPRISQPLITPQIYNTLPLSDSQKLMNTVISFFDDSGEMDEHYPIA